MYSTSENFKLIGYSDSDNGGNTDDRKSTSRYTFHFGIGVVSWASKKQPIVTLFIILNHDGNMNSINKLRI